MVYAWQVGATEKKVGFVPRATMLRDDENGMEFHFSEFLACINPRI